MAGEVGVLIIHGMGTQKEDFAETTITQLRVRVEVSGADAHRLRFKTVYWAPLLEEGEDELWSRLDLEALRWDWLRKFVVEALGDAVAYRKTERGAPREIYAEIHKSIHAALGELRSDMGDVDGPLVVMAHSLGCNMMSNFIWDAQTNKGYPEGPAPAEWSPFERMETLTGFVTFGCNIPLFTLAYLLKEDVTAITFPPPTLSPELRRVAKWLNLYDVDDVLGYPLKDLSESYREAVTKEIRINAGGLLYSWNPLSHAGYWGDNNLIRPTAELLVDILGVV